MLVHDVCLAQRAAHVLCQPLADACWVITVITWQHFGLAVVFVWVEADGAAFGEVSLLVLGDGKRLDDDGSLFHPLFLLFLADEQTERSAACKS